jgi:outer membrane protein assembly complex protein YaeT
MIRGICAALLAVVLGAGCATVDLTAPGAPTQEITVNGVDLEFEGAVTFSAEALAHVARLELRHLDESDNRRAALDDAAYAMESFYRSQGFARALVDYETGEDAEGELHPVFEIQEGARTRLARLEFRGNRRFPQETLAALLPGPATKDERWFVEGDIDDLVDAVELLYATSGYVKVTIEPPLESFSPDRASVSITIAIDEGLLYTVREVKFSGDTTTGAKKLDALAADAVGKTYSPSLARRLLAESVEVYGRRGFPDAKVRLERETLGDDGSVSLSFLVVPGEEVRIGEVVVRGNNRVDDDLILGRVELGKGEAYDVEKERETLRKLYESGLFSSVRVDLEGEGPERTLAIVVVEARSRELYVEPGYGSYEKLRLGVGWRDIDFFGTGLTFKAEGTVSALAQRVSTSLGDPHFLGTDVEAAVSLFGGHRIEPSFTSDQYGGALSFSRRLSPRVELIGSYQLSHSNAYDVDSVTAAASDQAINVGSVILTPRYDSRDSPIAPHSGTLGQVAVEYAPLAAGSTFDFLRMIWGLNHFVPVTDGTVLGLSWRGGILAPFQASQVVPIQERFFNGGENTVRCFEEDELGPVDSLGNPIGGEAFNVFSAEVRQNLVGNLDAALFVDVGNVAVAYTDFLRFRDMEGGPGVGLRYMLPVGPVRLDVAWNPDPARDLPSIVFHLAVGMSF